MSGTIYRRGQSWCVGFTVNGRRVRETVGPNKRIAERVLSLRMTQVLENRYFPPSRQLGRMPFKDFAQMYLEREGLASEVDPDRAESGAGLGQRVRKSFTGTDHASRDRGLETGED